MLIYYLTGYPPRTDTGGGGLANKSLIKAGEDRGHTIEVYSSEEEVPSIRPDLYWLSNMNGRFSLKFIEEATDRWNIPFIVQDDAYQNLCPQPTREYKLCFQDRYLEGELRSTKPGCNPRLLDTFLMYPDEAMTYDNCRNICRAFLMGKLLERCKASISVSPMHGEIWRKIFPQVEGKQVIVEPQIDPNVFKATYPGEYDRQDDLYAYVGTIAKGKGYLNCLQYVDIQGGRLVSIGDVHHTIPRKVVRNGVGHIPYHAMPRTYSQVAYLIHLPEWPEPQGRNVIEALLCGCKVIVNDKVGALSYPWMDTHLRRNTYRVQGMGGNYHMVSLSIRTKRFSQRIGEAPQRFWDDLAHFVEGV